MTSQIFVPNLKIWKIKEPTVAPLRIKINFRNGTQGIAAVFIH